LYDFLYEDQRKMPGLRRKPLYPADLNPDFVLLQVVQ
jgi:hypothetical protein